MKAKFLIIALLILLASAVDVQAQSNTDTTKKKTQKKYQAKAPETTAIWSKSVQVIW